MKEKKVEVFEVELKDGKYVIESKDELFRSLIYLDAKGNVKNNFPANYRLRNLFQWFSLHKEKFRRANKEDLIKGNMYNVEDIYLDCSSSMKVMSKNEPEKLKHICLNAQNLGLFVDTTFLSADITHLELSDKSIDVYECVFDSDQLLNATVLDYKNVSLSEKEIVNFIKKKTSDTPLEKRKYENYT